MKSFITILLLIGAAQCASAASGIPDDHSMVPKQQDVRSFSLQLRGFAPELPGDPRSFTGTSFVDPPSAYEAPSRSPFLAGLFSIVVPGSGEIYTENYWRAGIFLAAEIIGWIYNIKYNNNGDNQTNLFQNYADTHWDAVRYAQWLNTYASTFKGGDKAVTIEINPNTSLPPWERVNWAQMNTTESVIPEFSHRLPKHGDQQYYELIGKYQQYNHGWDDSDPNTAVYYTNLSPHFPLYSAMRGKANEYYNTASTIAALLVVNHILSAIDAAWSAVQFNSRYQFQSSIEYRPTPYGYIEAVPTASFTVRF